MSEDAGRQYANRPVPGTPAVRRGFEAVVPNPKLKLLDQVREVMRLKHYAIRTETALPIEHPPSAVLPHGSRALTSADTERRGDLRATATEDGSNVGRRTSNTEH